jgi:heat shock protein HtpX
MTVFWNGLKTAVLLGLMMGLCVAIGAIWGTRGLALGFAFGGVSVFVSYFFSAKIALASVNAKPISQTEAPELYAIVEHLSQQAGIPMPRLYYSPEPAPNAFATGRNPRNGVVCVTAGLMQMMSEQELTGVIGHELAHIKHRDILISSIAAIIAGAISWLATWGFWFGGFGGRDNRGGGGDSGYLGLILMLLTVILAPLAAGLIQMAISRSREFAADSSGATYAGGPAGLISALRKLETANRQIPMNVSPAQTHMFIIRPSLPKIGNMANMFRTHPPTEARIAKLIAQMNDTNVYAHA